MKGLFELAELRTFCCKPSTYFTPSARHCLFFMDLYAHQAHLPDISDETMQSLLLATHYGK